MLTYPPPLLQSQRLPYADVLIHSVLCLLADTLCLMPTCRHTLPYAYLLTHSALCLLADTLCLMPTCRHTLPYAYLLTHSVSCLGTLGPPPPLQNQRHSAVHLADRCSQFTTYYSCFTSTKVQVLLPNLLLSCLLY